ncbi:heme exporter protein CcmD [Propionivibrio sp.]|uniref:heme exporter protein CcmD n=1 Tax=Propionivibrio sp. TaxID=2212460 RepID=UPI00262EBABB|nr:heme exporter protein CcmD [Propionivibrio sp.]
MFWNSFSEFLAMGNHGVYVWGSVGVMMIAMIVEPVLLIRGHKSLVARLKRQLRADRRTLSQG